MELERVEAQRERRRQIKEVRLEAYNLAAARRKKAEDYRRKAMEESIQRKNERYNIIKTGQQTLRQLTSSMEEVVSKTKAELKAEVESLNSKDMLTTENVLARVAKHSDSVLFPRLQNRFGTDEHEEDDDEHGDYLAQTAPAHMERGRASTRPSTTATTQSRKGSTVNRAQTAAGATPGRTLPLKLFSKEALDESLNILKVPSPFHSVLIAVSFGNAIPLCQQNVVRRRSVSPSSASPSATSKRSTGVGKTRGKATRKVVPGNVDADDDDDEWFRTIDECEPEEQRVDRSGVESREREDANTDVVSSPNGKSNSSKHIQRKNTPMPGDIEREASKASDYHRSTTQITENEGIEDAKHDFHHRVLSYQSSRKDTPFPEEISRAATASSSPGADGVIEENDGEETFEHFHLDGPDDAIDSRLASSHSAPCRSQTESFRTGDVSRPSTQGGRNTRLRPLTPDGTFRREYSDDHPLNGGKGKYSKERASGKKEILPKDYGVSSKKKKKYERVSEVVSKQEQRKMDLQRKLEALRKHQNDALLEVLEEERQAEESRNSMGRSVRDPAERNRCVMVVM